MTNLDSIFKSRYITLSTKVHLVKAMVVPVVMYGCESWTLKIAEHRRIDAFELWCWRRLSRVPWTARRSNQSILKEISPQCSLVGLMVKLKLQYFGHLMQRADSLEKTLMLGKIEGRRRRGRQRMRWLVGITNLMDMGGQLEAWRAAIHGVTKSRTWLSNWTELSVYMSIPIFEFVTPTPFPLLVPIRLFSMSVCWFWPCKQVHLYRLARFHTGVLICDTCFFLFLTSLCMIVSRSIGFYHYDCISFLVNNTGVPYKAVKLPSLKKKTFKLKVSK